MRLLSFTNAGTSLLAAHAIHPSSPSSWSVPRVLNTTRQPVLNLESQRAQVQRAPTAWLSPSRVIALTTTRTDAAPARSPARGAHSDNDGRVLVVELHPLNDRPLRTNQDTP
ncbi:hypothetical protein N803_12545 [Knoellia subterranea KCTC 19937]|uniref:Uncharacterized protein n=1 Tax=Knoellia subterranea KCTC 19937 TaxID=1385521 RepID=A0A0A0JL89_9MICO|nr:hypothetical protein N803_12545 [Knoellia subterranea KCTC 19937]